MKGREALRVEWNRGPYANESSESLRQLAARRFERPPLFYAREEGDADQTFPQSRRVEATYELPFQAHAAVEPLNCTADVRPDRVEVWLGTQDTSTVQRVLCQLSGLSSASVVVHNERSGRAFGRRANWDYPAEGWPQTWEHWIVATSAMQLFSTPEELRDPRKLSDGEIWGAYDVPYAVPSLRVAYSPLESGIRRAWWRSVAPSFTTFAVEAFVDELATAANKDPYELRMRLLAGEKSAPNFSGMADTRRRLRTVLRLAVERSNWGKPLPARHGRGLAVFFGCGTAVAHVVTVSTEPNRAVKVRKVVTAVDCGTVVNPDGAKAMIEGGINFGLAAALVGEITIINGAAEQSNFDGFKLLRMEDAPPIEIHFVPIQEPPGGLGEPSLPPIAPAVANAVFAACGKRVRRLPIMPERLN